jgi:hypothetical protein
MEKTRVGSVGIGSVVLGTSVTVGFGTVVGTGFAVAGACVAGARLDGGALSTDATDAPVLPFALPVVRPSLPLQATVNVTNRAATKPGRGLRRTALFESTTVP